SLYHTDRRSCFVQGAGNGVQAIIVSPMNALANSQAHEMEKFLKDGYPEGKPPVTYRRPGAPAAWNTEDVSPVPKNIYGVTKAASEDLCQLVNRNLGLPCIVLRTSRFFPEEDDNHEIRLGFQDQNLKVNEYLRRRVDIEDVVNAHLLAADRAAKIGFGK